MINKTCETVIKFANDVAKHIVIEEGEDLELSECVVKVITPWRNVTNILEKYTKFNEFLETQEQQITFQKEKYNWIEQTIEVHKRFLRDFEENKGEVKEFEDDIKWFMNVKSTKVIWDNNRESFMHAFINTTQIK